MESQRRCRQEEAQALKAAEDLQLQAVELERSLLAIEAERVGRLAAFEAAARQAEDEASHSRRMAEQTALELARSLARALAL